MPSETVRPRASRAPRLGAGALAEYQALGWRLTSGGPDAGMVTGPCARCHRRDHIRYGQTGAPLCHACHTNRPGGNNTDA